MNILKDCFELKHKNRVASNNFNSKAIIFLLMAVIGPTFQWQGWQLIVAVHKGAFHIESLHCTAALERDTLTPQSTVDLRS
jgi:hypothetical protein